MKDKGVSTFKIAATYIGTIVGAGFASGQEMLQFFSVFGRNGILGLIVVTILFIVYGAIIMELGSKLNSNSHLKIIRHSGGKYLGGAIDFLITFFLFGALTAMIAGSGAMLQQQFGIPAIVGNLAMAAVTAVTVLTGINGVINTISYIVPFLIVSVLGISIGSIFYSPPGPANVQVAAAAAGNGLIQNWFWSAILYTSYNTVLSIAVLGPLGAKAASRRAILRGALLGGLGLGIGSMAIFAAMSRNLEQVIGLEIPMAFVAGRIAFWVQLVYVVILFAEVYTTAVGSLYGFSARILDIKATHTTLLIVGATVLAFIASQFGFSNLVRYLYPIVGYAGVILLVCLIYGRLRLRKQQV